MKKSGQMYITTTLPYVNAEPHIGFALEIVQADTLARFSRLLGHDVFFNFGTDEHGAKIFEKARSENKDPQAYCDEYAEKFDSLKSSLSLSYDNFIRTTDPAHIRAAQKFWEICSSKGDIYKKSYSSKYCVGCEMEKTDSELVDGRCPLHPSRTIETIEEENYFFRFSKYQNPLLELYESRPDFIVPRSRMAEIVSFVRSGLNDFSISRLKQKMPWGIAVPNDHEHTMYVWFDALINYVSAIGWPDNTRSFARWWPVVQCAGKDNLRQQTAIWQAMLLSAGLPPSKQVFIHGFISSHGQKMSKSLKNVIHPSRLVRTYGTDAVRYYLLSCIHPYEDSDFTYEAFEQAYNAHLANGLGNVVSRIAALCERASYTPRTVHPVIFPRVSQHLRQYRFDYAIESIWSEIKTLDRNIEQQKPWKLTKTDLSDALDSYVKQVLCIAFNLQPFLPDASEAIIRQFSQTPVRTKDPLFPRLNRS